MDFYRIYSGRLLKQYDDIEQQVTAYPFQDLNNGWLFQKPDSLWNGSQSIEWVKDKEKVRLEHFSTLRKLHSHDMHAPLSQEAFEVT